MKNTRVPDLKTPPQPSSVRNVSFPFKKPGSAAWLLGSCNGLKLPDLGFKSEENEIIRLVSYGFGYVLATDDYKIVVAAILEDERLLEGNPNPLEIFSMRDRSWKRVEAPFLNRYESSELNGALSNEALHWLHFTHQPSYRQSIRSFDLGKEEFRDVELPVVNDDDNVFFTQAGVLFEGCLCALSHKHPNHTVLSVWVMREYDVRESWTMLYTFKIADQPGWMSDAEPIFLRESGMLVTQECGNMEKEFRWFDQEDENFDKYVVCGGRFLLDGSFYADYVMVYAESLLTFS